VLKQLFLLLKEMPLGKGDLIDVAKGKNEFPSNWAEIKKQAKWLSQK